jgi:hypothetical protein
LANAIVVRVRRAGRVIDHPESPCRPITAEPAGEATTHGACRLASFPHTARLPGRSIEPAQRLSRYLGFSLIPIGTPLACIPVHVAETEAVCREAPNGRSEAESVSRSLSGEDPLGIHIPDVGRLSHRLFVGRPSHANHPIGKPIACRIRPQRYKTGQQVVREGQLSSRPRRLENRFQVMSSNSKLQTVSVASTLRAGDAEFSAYAGFVRESDYDRNDGENDRQYGWAPAGFHSSHRSIGGTR